MDPGAVNNSARSVMAAVKKLAEDTGGGLAAGGTGNAITLGTNQALSSAHVAAGLTLKFRATATNTGATTLNVDSIGAVSVVDQFGADLAAGAITSGGIYTVTYNANTSKWVLENPAVIPAAAVASALPKGYLYGLTLSNNGSDATNDIDIATGEAVDATNVYVMRLASGLTKRLDAAWAVGTNQGGLDTGSIANTWYYMWLIARSDTGVVDVLFSASATAPTMPANYGYKRRIGAIYRTGGAIKAFKQDGDRVDWLVPVNDWSATGPTTTANTLTLTAPTGISVEAIVAVRARAINPSSGTYVLLTSLDQTDTVPSSSAFSFYMADTAGGSSAGSTMARIRTNTSGQIRWRQSLSNSQHESDLVTHGWVDMRGRLG